MVNLAAADDGPTIAQHSEFNPFPAIVYNPDRRYCADLTVWEAYEAALGLRELQERTRCVELLRAYTEKAPANVRERLLELITLMERPPKIDSVQRLHFK
jgi:hypothetical protein